jgi:protein-S-isoprenylcysteine O-methyltransferase Ste14
MALTTGNLWFAGVMAAMMGYNFIFQSIPELQAHNKAKYGRAFEEYSARTWKFIPFVY